MIQTRPAETDDEAWMIERLNQQNYEINDFKPRNFLLLVDDDLEKRLGFGSIQYVRNNDGTEYAEIGNVILNSTDELKHGQQLLVDLIDSLNRKDKNEVFAFPTDNTEIFRSVGFSDPDSMPSVMEEHFKQQSNRHSSVTPLVVHPRDVKSVGNDKEESQDKPDGVDSEEVEKMKEELEIDDETTTKYSL